MPSAANSRDESRTARDRWGNGAPDPPAAVPDPDHLPKGLPRNDAVTLFAERGATAVPGFELTEENKVTIARICQRLDGCRSRSSWLRPGFAR